MQHGVEYSEINTVTLCASRSSTPSSNHCHSMNALTSRRQFWGNDVSAAWTAENILYKWINPRGFSTFSLASPVIENLTKIELATDFLPFIIQAWGKCISSCHIACKLWVLLSKNTSIFPRLMHQSIPAVPIPPRATVGHLLTCQSRGWGISKFYRCPGAGH